MVIVIMETFEFTDMVLVRDSGVTGVYRHYIGDNGNIRVYGCGIRGSEDIRAYRHIN